MSHKPADELLSIQGEQLVVEVLPVVLPPEGYLACCNVDDPVIANGNPVGVLSQLLHNRLWPSHRLFTVNIPVFLIELFFQ